MSAAEIPTRYSVEGKAKAGGRGSVGAKVLVAATSAAAVAGEAVAASRALDGFDLRENSIVLRVDQEAFRFPYNSNTHRTGRISLAHLENGLGPTRR